MASTNNLTASTLHSISWTTAATVVTAVLQIGYTAVMARLLTPAAFGLVALAGVVLRFGTYFSQIGLEQALVQKAEISEEDVRAAFTSAALLGGLCAAVLALSAPLATLVFQEPAVVPLVRVMSLGLLVNGLSATALAILRRQMAFRTLAVLETISYVLAYAGLGIVLAWRGFGVWSLVAASLAQGVLVAVLAYGATRHSLRFYFHWSRYRPLLSYGWRISFTSFLEFITSSLDTLLIGRVLGATLLGIYNRAAMLITLPLYLLTHSVSRVVFPAFSQIQADVVKLRAVYLGSVTLVAAVVLPLGAGVAVAAPVLVQTLLGPGWEMAVPVLRILCAAVPLSLITMFAGIVCDARATLRAKVNANLLALATLVGFFWLLHGYGLVGFAGALVLNEGVRTLLYMRLMHLDLGLSYRRLSAAYGPGLLHGAAVGVALGGASLALSYWALPAPTALALLMLGGALVLAMLMLAWPRPLLRRELHSLLSRLAVGQAPGAPGPATRALARYLQFLNQSAPFAGRGVPELESVSSLQS
ncbi:lipopolysaccharide biosynthesis protein [Hymenobacter sp. BT683]|uniref:Lipopolysaccharide biosynthesis protein n=1 Tax=Hymenobacter jeongseonensis TaxID=2791027 RepID=A0ABS0ID66_9BACT|nr:lipopolysaccharide biosynthesis protein [Hymenobacter jeongseonensis]MBF9236260.1 lipopolysaccharide biosynthesis protein [Hymenobacter jeongseonensis]